VSCTALIFAACCSGLTSCRFPPKSPSSILMPMAPAFRIPVTDLAAASGVSPYPASRSIDTGTGTAAVIRDTRPVTMSNGTSSPSAYPSADATAALLVATAGKAFAMALAVAASQALNRTSGPPFLKTAKRLGVLLLRLGVHCALLIREPRRCWCVQSRACVLNQSMIRSVTSASRSRCGKCPMLGSSIFLYGPLKRGLIGPAYFAVGSVLP